MLLFWGLFTVALGSLTQAEQLWILNPPPKLNQPLPIITLNNVRHINLSQLGVTLGVRSYYRSETGKLVFFFEQGLLKFTAHSSFCMVDNRVFQLSSNIIVYENQILAPLESTLQLMRSQILPTLQYKITTDSEEVLRSPTALTPRPSSEPALGTLSQLTFEERQNGLTLKINTDKDFQEYQFAHFFKDDWLYITIYGAKGDTAQLSCSHPAPGIEQVETLSFSTSMQIGLKLTRQFERAEVVYDQRNRQILISLFLPLNRATLKKIEAVKNSWKVDTIVLDPGHGGRDPGTPGRWGLMDEKDIVLDIALRVGKLLERHQNLKVVYTRKTDVFVPLWQRTKIANDAGGKLFLSFHVNAMLENSRGQAEGIELYLQNPTVRTKDAIEVAKLENAAIQYETLEDKAKYQNFDNPSHILANMVFQTHLHDSEKFAEILSHRLGRMLPQKNRGVKQANLYVLVGASMPNLLCEFGYNDNKKEAKLLNTPQHRQKIAEAVYHSIMEFKEYCDQTIQ